MKSKKLIDSYKKPPVNKKLRDSFMNKLQTSIKLSEVEEIQEYNKWTNKIPYINFPESWEVKIIPPFSGAIIRFCIKRKNLPGEVSVYLDCYDRLAMVGKPYWEVYAINKAKDVHRCLLKDDTKELLETIDYALGNKRRRLNRNLTKKS